MGLGRDEFAKYHALGNDYIVVDGDALRPRLDPERVRALCDRHTGIGSDGILALHRPRRGEILLRIWNPDGSEAEKSGNGVRIFARFLWDFRYVRARELEIDTAGGPRARAARAARQGGARDPGRHGPGVVPQHRPAHAGPAARRRRRAAARRARSTCA